MIFCYFPSSQAVFPLVLLPVPSLLTQCRAVSSLETVRVLIPPMKEYRCTVTDRWRDVMHWLLPSDPSQPQQTVGTVSLSPAFVQFTCRLSNLCTTPLCQWIRANQRVCLRVSVCVDEWHHCCINDSV